MTDAAAAPQDTGFNPWLSMWLAPRRTVRRLLDTDPDRNVFLLACLVGIGEALSRVSDRSLGDQYPLAGVVAVAVVGGVLGGLMSLYLWSFLFRWTGSWLKGRATSTEMRTAVAWAGVPMVWGLVLWLPLIAILGEEMFTTATPRLDAYPPLMFTLLAFVLIELVLAVWAFVLLIRSIAEAQGFGAWKGLANFLIALALFAGTIGLLVAGYVGFKALPAG